MLIDDDAAGLGWFVDPTPLLDEEFGSGGSARPGTAAAAGVDLLTVLAHELGHVLGRPDLDVWSHPDDVMAEELGRGVRRTP